jgi:hypothetical protein
VAEFIFCGFGQFAKAGAGSVRDEERIVSESAGTSFHGGDVSFDGSLEFCDDVSGFGESEDAAKPCAAVMATGIEEGEFGEQFGAVSGIVSMAAAVARGINARGSPEDVDFQS